MSLATNTARLLKLSLSLSFAIPCGAARIEGVVVDDQQRPVEGVSVTADNLTPGSRLTVKAGGHAIGENVIAWTATDKNGHFVIDHLSPGKYWIFAQKEEDGYGDTGSTIYAAGRPPAPVASLAAPGDAAQVTVNPGRPGIVMRIRVADSFTGQALASARCEIRIQAQEHQVMTTSISQDGVILPLPIVPFAMTIVAAGFQSLQVPLESAKPGMQITRVFKLKSIPAP